MKKMKKLLLFTLLIASTAIMAQPQLSWRFANAQLINGDTQLQFDVEVMADAPNYFIGLTNVSFNYGNEAFGPNIYPDHLSVDRGVLMLEEFSGSFKYDLIGLANTYAQTFGLGTFPLFGGLPAGATFHTMWPTTWTQMYIFTIDINVPGSPPPADILAEIEFNQILMNGQNFYVAPAGGSYLPCVDPSLYDNDLLSFVVVAGGAIGTEWTGAIDGDWFTAGNWSAGVPDAGIDATIPDVGGKAPFPTISGGLATTGTLTISPAAQLIVAANGSLTTNGLFTNDGFFGVISDPAGNSGTYIDGGGIAGVGTFEYWRDFGAPAGFLDNEGWHFVSAPIAGFSTDDILDYYLNLYDESLASYVHIEGTYPCIPVSPAIVWAPLQGWSMKFQPEYLTQCGAGGTGTVIEFSGGAPSVHTATPPASIPGGFTAVGPDPAHYNLMGNPFYSALDADLMVPTWPAQLNTSIWQYDNNNLTWAPWSAGSPGFNNVIAPTQGFLVSATAGGTLNVDNTMRVHGGTFLKDEVENVLIVQASGNGYADKIYVRFMEEATANYDGHWDATKLMSTALEVPQIYTTTAGAELSIDLRPATEVVPMEFVSGTSATYTIEAIETSNFSEITLEDVANEVFTNLLTDSYTFDYTTGETQNFIIHFGPLGVNDNLAGNVNIWSNEHKIYVQTSTTDRGDIVVYNMMGQEVVRTDIAPGLNTIPMTEVNTYYVVKVLTSDNAVTGKVYIK
jgi:hypothetical protein